MYLLGKIWMCTVLPARPALFCGKLVENLWKTLAEQWITSHLCTHRPELFTAYPRVIHRLFTSYPQVIWTPLTTASRASL